MIWSFLYFYSCVKVPFAKTAKTAVTLLKTVLVIWSRSTEQISLLMLMMLRIRLDCMILSLLLIRHFHTLMRQVEKGGAQTFLILSYFGRHVSPWVFNTYECSKKRVSTRPENLSHLFLDLLSLQNLKETLVHCKRLSIRNCSFPLENPCCCYCLHFVGD